MLSARITPVPIVVLWSITRACNLACRHCHAVGKPAVADGELSTEEALALVDRFAEWDIHVIVLTGGEPLMRRDVFDIAGHLKERRLDHWLVTNGWLVTEEVTRRIADLSFSRVLVSLDSSRPERHDAFRNRSGCFERAVAAIRRLVAAEVHVGIIATINRMNIDELDDLVALARRLGVSHVTFETFKPTRASQTQVWNGQPMNLTPDEWRRVYTRILNIQNQTPDMTLEIGGGGREPLTALLEDIRPNNECPACDCGHTLTAVEANGDVTYCIYAPELILGNLRQDDLPTLWRTAPLVRRLRERMPIGKCRECALFARCGGGCPAVIWNTYGRLDEPDPNCWWQPETAAADRQRVTVY